METAGDLEWAELMSLVNKISDEEEKIEGGWDELADMVADAIVEEEHNINMHDAFFTLLAFLLHLKYRIRRNRTKRPFNVVSEVDGAMRIVNYDYKTFKWAKNICADCISNDIIDLPITKLNEQQLKALRSRIGK